MVGGDLGLRASLRVPLGKRLAVTASTGVVSEGRWTTLDGDRFAPRFEPFGTRSALVVSGKVARDVTFHPAVTLTPAGPRWGNDTHRPGLRHGYYQAMRDLSTRQWSQSAGIGITIGGGRPDGSLFGQVAVGRQPWLLDARQGCSPDASRNALTAAT